MELSQLNNNHSEGIKSHFFTLLIVFLSLQAPLGYAEDLLEIYMLAQCHDPIIHAAKEAQLAAAEKCPQARSLFLPTIKGTASELAYNKIYGTNKLTFSTFTIPLTSTHFHYDQNFTALTLSQPIFYYQQWVQLAKASDEVKKANAVFAAAEQDLIVRTVQAYFGVLRAMDALKYAKSQTYAFQKIYEQTDQRFKAGVSTIKDAQVAKAKYDSAYANKIAAENTLSTQKISLKEITGCYVTSFASLTEQFNILAPSPNDICAWVEMALDQNLNLQVARYEAETARQDVKLNNANHLPTLNINGSLAHTSATKDIIPFPKNLSSFVGIQLDMPLFSGGNIISKTKQARHLYLQSLQEMETTHRQVETSTQVAFLGVITQMNQISAFKQAITSNTTALAATQDSYKVGTATIVDLLTAESDLIKAQQDYANARYDYILQNILLKQAAGTLCPIDLEHINTWLKTSCLQ